jgi:nucleotide-binding universal stress UspA family protein
MYKVIMAPTEGSDAESGAISAAVKLAQRFGADLHLVRVLTAPLVIEMVPSPPVLEITEQTLRDERAARLHKLEALGTELRTLGHIGVVTALVDGRVSPTLRDYANESNVDLIVMSSHSRGGLKRVTLGSVTDFLIRNTHIPVLVVKPPAAFIGATHEETVARIVVPLDGSAMAEQILPEVAALALGLNATVHLLQVLTPQTYSQEQIVEPGYPWWEAAIAGADAYLSGPAGSLAKDGVKVNKEVILGESVATAIMDYAARIEANLIAIATSGSGGMTRFVFGSVADAVTRQSPTSLLVFHPRREAATSDAPDSSDAQALTGA